MQEFRCFNRFWSYVSILIRSFIFLDPPSVPSFKIDNVNATKISIIEGKTYNVICDSDSNPVPSSYIWTFAGNEYTSEVLELKNVQRNMSGTYTCKVENIMNPTFGEAVRGTSTNNISIEVFCKYIQHIEVSNYLFVSVFETLQPGL